MLRLHALRAYFHCMIFTADLPSPGHREKRFTAQGYPGPVRNSVESRMINAGPHRLGRRILVPHMVSILTAVEQYLHALSSNWSNLTLVRYQSIRARTVPQGPSRSPIYCVERDRRMRSLARQHTDELRSKV